MRIEYNSYHLWTSGYLPWGSRDTASECINGKYFLHKRKYSGKTKMSTAYSPQYVILTLNYEVGLDFRWDLFAEILLV